MSTNELSKEIYMSQTILITGTSAGFGNLMTRTLLSNGHKVIASMRDIAGRNKTVAAELAQLGAKIVELDVTSEDSVKTAIHNAIKEAGNIDMVVNNAGVGVIGRQESFEIKDWEKLFNINVFGVQRVLREIIPHFRENGKGTIVNVSSILGRMTIPYYGPYNASKYALEAMSENYRMELSQFGIDVALIEPGGFPTTFMERLITPSDTDREKFYDEVHPTPQEFGENFAKALESNPAQNPQDVADALLNLVNTPAGDRPFRTVVDKMGMGDAVTPYNEASDNVTKGVFSSFGIDHLLTIKK